MKTVIEQEKNISLDRGYNKNINWTTMANAEFESKKRYFTFAGLIIWNNNDNFYKFLNLSSKINIFDKLYVFIILQWKANYGFNSQILVQFV